MWNRHGIIAFSPKNYIKFIIWNKNVQNLISEHTNLVSSINTFSLDSAWTLLKATCGDFQINCNCIAMFGILLSYCPLTRTSSCGLIISKHTIFLVGIQRLTSYNLTQFHLKNYTKRILKLHRCCLAFFEIDVYGKGGSKE